MAAPGLTRRTVLAGIVLPAPAARAASAAAAPPWPGALLRGRGEQRVFGFKVFEAQLWTGEAFDADRYAEQPFALRLQYARRLDGAAIVERSIDEMRRIEPIEAERERRWRAAMREAFPDVADGDDLTGLHEGGGRVRFEHNARPTAAWQDVDFVRLFFGIWLHPRTSEPALRRALIAR